MQFPSLPGLAYSTVDVISGVLKTRKADSCSLQVCIFLIRNPIRDHFPEIFCKLKSTFKKFGQEFAFSSVAKFVLYACNSVLVKSGRLDISRRATFRKVPCACQVSQQNCKTQKLLVTLPKDGSTTDALSVILKILQTNK